MSLNLILWFMDELTNLAHKFIYEANVGKLTCSMHLFSFLTNCLKALGTMRKGNHDEERCANPGQ